MISPFNESFYREELDNNFTLKQLHIIAQMLDVEGGLSGTTTRNVLIEGIVAKTAKLMVMSVTIEQFGRLLHTLKSD